MLLQLSFIFPLTIIYAESAKVSQIFAFSDDIKQFILDLHNDFRNEVAKGKVPGQPGAQNMQTMEWDEDLADMAKAYSEKCRFKHSVGDVGENLAVATLHTSINDENELKQNIKARFDKWAMEAENFAYPTTCKKKQCGHYKQLVWHDTTKVGCGLTECKGMKHWEEIGNRLAVILVCNYSPMGNYRGQAPYECVSPCNVFKKTKITSGQKQTRYLVEMF